MAISSAMMAAIADPAERMAAFQKMVAEMYERGKALNTAAAFYCGTFIFISIGYNLIWQAMVRFQMRS